VVRPRRPFYHAVKYQVALAYLPKRLHWFYWEAYTTFLSGFFLLCLLYYGQAEIYLIDPAVASLSKPGAIAIGLAFIAGGWLVYDGLCRTPFARNDLAIGLVLATLLAAAAWALCHLFSGRGAFIQFGVRRTTRWRTSFVIIPGQRAMVRAMGRQPDLQEGLKGRLRSTHNTYFTLPVLFTMISNHYAMTFGARYNWLVLIVMSAAGVLIRVYFVNRHSAHMRDGRTSPLPAALAALLLAGLAFALATARSAAERRGTAATATGVFGRFRASFISGAPFVIRRCRPREVSAHRRQASGSMRRSSSSCKQPEWRGNSPLAPCPSAT
jgi:uncharacterized membrane protein